MTALAACPFLAATQPSPIAVEPQQVVLAADGLDIVQRADIIDEIIEIIEKIINPGGGGNP